LQPCRLCGDGLDVFLEDPLLRRGGTVHRTKPAAGGWTPIGLPWRAQSVPPQEGFAPSLGGLQSPEGIVSRPPHGAYGFGVDRRHVHGREVPGAHEPSQ
jgi:hypothetical protein